MLEVERQKNSQKVLNFFKRNYFGMWNFANEITLDSGILQMKFKK
jgi:hypothetical protein